MSIFSSNYYIQPSNKNSDTMNSYIVTNLSCMKYTIIYSCYHFISYTFFRMYVYYLNIPAHNHNLIFSENTVVYICVVIIMCSSLLKIQQKYLYMLSLDGIQVPFYFLLIHTFIMRLFFLKLLCTYIYEVDVT